MNNRSVRTRKSSWIRGFALLAALSLLIACFFVACSGGGIQDLNKKNYPPSKPVNLSPENGAVNIGEGPRLEWEPCEDPENDPLTYILLYSTDTINNSKVQTLVATETFALLPDLSLGTWWWRVLVVDAGNNMMRGDRWSFTVGSDNLPKTDSPHFDTDLIVVDLARDGVTLSWPAFYDEENPVSEIVYDLRVDDPLNLSSERKTDLPALVSQEARYLEVATSTEATTIRLTGLSALTRFDGSLVARSASNTQTAVGFFSFTTGNTLPSTPVYLFPENRAAHLPATPTFRWNLCEDKDGDTLTYDIYIGEDQQTAQRFTRGASEGSYTPQEPLEMGREYLWRIVVKDGKGGNRVGEWWSFTVGNATPISLEPIKPQDGETNVPTRTSLEWSCADPDGDTLTYTLRFGTAPNKMAVIGKGLKNTVYSFQNPLAYNQKYYWQVLADDGQGVTNRATLTGVVWEFTTQATPNFPPDKPTLQTPGNGATNVSNAPQLTWTCKDDNPEDVLVYTVYTGKSEATLTARGTTTRMSFNLSGLEYQQKYYWKVVADDGRPSSERKTAVSDTWSFTTQATPNFPPDKPTLNTPGNGATNVSNAPQLTWTCKDDNPEDILVYTVYTGKSEATLTSRGTTSQMSFNLSGLEYQQKYYWKVVADDGRPSSERKTAVSDTWSFTTQATPNSPPQAPHTPKPTDGATNVSRSPKLEWQCTDPDNDVLEFAISWGSTNTALTNSATTANRFYSLSDLATGTTYYWRVKADDKKGQAERSQAESPIWNFKTTETK